MFKTDHDGNWKIIIIFALFTFPDNKIRYYPKIYLFWLLFYCIEQVKPENVILFM